MTTPGKRIGFSDAVELIEFQMPLSRALPLRHVVRMSFERLGDPGATIRRPR